MKMTDLKETIFVPATPSIPMWSYTHYSDVFALDGKGCMTCEELAGEAWERMTFSGVVGGRGISTVRPGCWSWLGINYVISEWEIYGFTAVSP